MIFIDYKGKKGNFTVEKPGWHCFNQEFKVTITINGTNQHHVSPDRLVTEDVKQCDILGLEKKQHQVYKLVPDGSGKKKIIYKWKLIRQMR